ncbi:MAG: DNA-binding transcriptional MerR regulator [Flavobacteriales bacterium]|jgi:DNA-binding transcriptional MerR regulator
MNITQLSKVTRVPERTLRHYLQIGLLEDTEYDTEDRPQFSDSHIHTVKLIKLATDLGFRLREILELLDARYRQDESALQAAMDVFLLRKNHIETNHPSSEQLTQLACLQRELEKLIAPPCLSE